MQIDKEDVVNLLRERGEHDKAVSVGCALPRQIDTEQDAGLLHTFDVNVGDLTPATGTDADTEEVAT